MARVDDAQVTSDKVPAFQPFTGIYEPSAIQQLPDGRFLVVEDEKSHPLSLVTIGADGSCGSKRLVGERQPAGIEPSTPAFRR